MPALDLEERIEFGGPEVVSEGVARAVPRHENVVTLPADLLPATNDSEAEMFNDLVRIPEVLHSQPDILGSESEVEAATPTGERPAVWAIHTAVLQYCRGSH